MGTDRSSRIPAREHSRTIAASLEYHLEAIVLDFVNPLRFARSLLRDGRIAGLDKTRRQYGRATRGTPFNWWEI
jgi:hypothetical protein